MWREAPLVGADHQETRLSRVSVCDTNLARLRYRDGVGSAG
jgi:hypothetical protein